MTSTCRTIIYDDGRTSLNLSKTRLSRRQVYELIQEMSVEFTGRAYNIISRYIAPLLL